MLILYYAEYFNYIYLQDSLRTVNKEFAETNKSAIPKIIHKSNVKNIKCIIIPSNTNNWSHHEENSSNNNLTNHELAKINSINDSVNEIRNKCNILNDMQIVLGKHHPLSTTEQLKSFEENTVHIVVESRDKDPDLNIENNSVFTAGFV